MDLQAIFLFFQVLKENQIEKEKSDILQRAIELMAHYEQIKKDKKKGLVSEKEYKDIARGILIELNMLEKKKNQLMQKTMNAAKKEVQKIESLSKEIRESNAQKPKLPPIDPDEERINFALKLRMKKHGAQSTENKKREEYLKRLKRLKILAQSLGKNSGYYNSLRKKAKEFEKSIQPRQKEKKPVENITPQKIEEAFRRAESPTDYYTPVKEEEKTKKLREIQPPPLKTGIKKIKALERAKNDSLISMEEILLPKLENIKKGSPKVQINRVLRGNDFVEKLRQKEFEKLDISTKAKKLRELLDNKS